jgi:cytidine deaminase
MSLPSHDESRTHLAQADRLLAAAKEASAQAYAPYSDFPVGAALLLKDGAVVTGVNVENASFGLTLCAERCAIAKAVSQGQKEFVAIAVWAEKRQHGAITPCGACRQVLAEFMEPGAWVVMADPQTGAMRMRTINDLLPAGFAFNP